MIQAASIESMRNMAFPIEATHKIHLHLQKATQELNLAP